MASRKWGKDQGKSFVPTDQEGIVRRTSILFKNNHWGWERDITRWSEVSLHRIEIDLRLPLTRFNWENWSNLSHWYYLSLFYKVLTYTRETKELWGGLKIATSEVKHWSMMSSQLRFWVGKRQELKIFLSLYVLGIRFEIKEHLFVSLKSLLSFKVCFWDYWLKLYPNNFKLVFQKSKKYTKWWLLAVNITFDFAQLLFPLPLFLLILLSLFVVIKI